MLVSLKYTAIMYSKSLTLVNSGSALTWSDRCKTKQPVPFSTKNVLYTEWISSTHLYLYVNMCWQLFHVVSVSCLYRDIYSLVEKEVMCHMLRMYVNYTPPQSQCYQSWVSLCSTNESEQAHHSKLVLHHPGRDGHCGCKKTQHTCYVKQQILLLE